MGYYPQPPKQFENKYVPEFSSHPQQNTSTLSPVVSTPSRNLIEIDQAILHAISKTKMISLKKVSTDVFSVEFIKNLTREGNSHQFSFGYHHGFIHERNFVNFPEDVNEKLCAKNAEKEIECTFNINEKSYTVKLTQHCDHSYFFPFEESFKIVVLYISINFETDEGRNAASIFYTKEEMKIKEYRVKQLEIITASYVKDIINLRAQIMGDVSISFNENEDQLSKTLMEWLVWSDCMRKFEDSKSYEPKQDEIYLWRKGRDWIESEPVIHDNSNWKIQKVRVENKIFIRKLLNYSSQGQNLLWEPILNHKASLVSEYIIKIEGIHLKKRDGIFDIEIFYAECNKNDSYCTLSQLPIFAKQVLEGIKAMHSIHIVHLDIKLENIVYLPTFGFKIIDFGSAYDLMDPILPNAINTTEENKPPELNNEKPSIGKPIDIYTYGKCLIRFIREILKKKKIKVDNWNDIRNRIKEFNESLVEVIEQCIKINPNNRPTCDELLKMDYFKQQPALVFHKVSSIDAYQAINEEIQDASNLYYTDSDE
mmetsp:Transcript_8875/g.13182  ORF Transcript_8875/g.13182 Transcript_8875/m.13182 type:complete len:538 (-) Transcript_8875:79-1692(-)